MVGPLAAELVALKTPVHMSNAGVAPKRTLRHEG